jgi:hypothetical protein
MQDLLVTGCTFEDITSGQGTAIFLEEIQDAVIENNTFINNRRDIQIFKWYQASVPVSNVMIRNNVMSGTQDAVFAIFNAEHSSGQTRFDGVTFTSNTAYIDPNIDDDRGAVYAGAHSNSTGAGGIGWDTVSVTCNNFVDARDGSGVRYWAPDGVADDQMLGGASLNTTLNWWGSDDASTVAALMQNPGITEYEPFLPGEYEEGCPPSINTEPIPSLSTWGLILLIILFPLGVFLMHSRGDKDRFLD